MKYLIFILLSLTAGAQTKKCEAVFANHYGESELKKMSNRDLFLYTEQIMNCHLAMPKSDGSLAASFKQIKVSVEVHSCTLEVATRLADYMNRKGLMSEFLAEEPKR